MNPQYREALKTLSMKIGGLDWVEADWVIEVLRDENPVLASLYLGWRKGYNWLARQVANIKQEVKKSGA